MPPPARGPPKPNPKMLERAKVLKTKTPTSIPEQLRKNMEKKAEKNNTRKRDAPTVKQQFLEKMQSSIVDNKVKEMLKNYPKVTPDTVTSELMNEITNDLAKDRRLDKDMRNEIMDKWVEKIKERSRSSTANPKTGKDDTNRLFDDSSSKMDAIDLSDEEFSRLEVPSSGTDLSDTDLSEYSSDSDMEEELHMMPKAMFTQEPPKYEGNYNSSFSKSIYKY